MTDKAKLEADIQAVWDEWRHTFPNMLSSQRAVPIRRIRAGIIWMLKQPEWGEYELRCLVRGIKLAQTAWEYQKSKGWTPNFDPHFYTARMAFRVMHKETFTDWEPSVHLPDIPGVRQSDIVNIIEKDRRRADALQQMMEAGNVELAKEEREQEKQAAQAASTAEYVQLVEKQKREWDAKQEKEATDGN